MTNRVTKRNGSTEPFSQEKIEKAVIWATKNTNVPPQLVIDNAIMLIYDGIKTSDIQEALISAASKLTSATMTDASFVAARLLLLDLYKIYAASKERSMVVVLNILTLRITFRGVFLATFSTLLYCKATT
ncbi:ATP cone domain-containing protein [Acinetobacter baumannii]|uniref:ATP cone domain-containing protein n=1 Tax=Acinetobacter baumannii TaxID=470 RepID=UPI00044E9A8F|nr:ATP cone domain-containing protein [Acinetobacter baumannii]EXS13088.1 ATP cone domain protein [Acinetobacter baumannii 628418]